MNKNNYIDGLISHLKICQSLRLHTNTSKESNLIFKRKIFDCSTTNFIIKSKKTTQKLKQFVSHANKQLSMGLLSKESSNKYTNTRTHFFSHTNSQE